MFKWACVGIVIVNILGANNLITQILLVFKCYTYIRPTDQQELHVVNEITLVQVVPLHLKRIYNGS